MNVQIDQEELQRQKREALARRERLFGPPMRQAPVITPKRPGPRSQSVARSPEEVAEMKRARNRVYDKKRREKARALREGAALIQRAIPRVVPALPEGYSSSRPTVMGIMRFVAEYYGYTALDLQSSSRAALVVEPRHVAMYLSRTLTPRSYPQISHSFGKRDNATTLYAVRKIAALVAADSNFAAEVEALRLKLTGGDNADTR